LALGLSPRQAGVTDWLFTQACALHNDIFKNVKGHMKQTSKVVMQVKSVDKEAQFAIIGQLRNIMAGLPDIEIEVVCHSKGLALVLDKTSRVAAHIASLSGNNVRFLACEKALERANLTASDLVPHVITVPSGLVEIIRRQSEGWSYVHGGN